TEIDRERKLVAFERLEARPFISVPDLHAARNAQEPFRRRLLDDACLLDEQHEGRRTAVHDGKLGGVEIDVNIVHAESAERGHQMLDGVDLDAVAYQARRQARLADEFGARRKINWRGEVDAPEYDSGIRRRGAHADAHLLSGVEPDA